MTENQIENIEVSTLESQVKDIIKQRLTDGTVERLMSEQLEKGISAALESLFGRYGDVSKAIEAKLKEVLLPFVEAHNYAEYVVKLDAVLTDLLNQTQIENRELMSNFKDLMAPDFPKTLTLSEVFEKYQEHVAEEVKVDGLDVAFDDGPVYDSVKVTCEIEEQPPMFDWSSFKTGVIQFRCPHDKKIGFGFADFMLCV